MRQLHRIARARAWHRSTRIAGVTAPDAQVLLEAPAQRALVLAAKPARIRTISTASSARSALYRMGLNVHLALSRVVVNRALTRSALRPRLLRLPAPAQRPITSTLRPVARRARVRLDPDALCARRVLVNSVLKTTSSTRRVTLVSALGTAMWILLWVLVRSVPLLLAATAVPAAAVATRCAAQLAQTVTN